MSFVATWADLENITVSEISQKEKDMLYDVTYMWNTKNSENESVCKQKQTHRHRKYIYRYRKGTERDSDKLGAWD